MFLRKLFLATTALLLFCGAAVAGEIAPGLQDLLDRTDDTTPVKVMVFMRDRVDVTSLDLELHLEKAPLATRHLRVINELQEVAKTSQTSLLADLSASRADGSVLGYHSHWIVNGVVVTATKDAIYRLAEREDVDRIEPNIVPELIEPVAEHPADPDSRGIGITPGVKNIGARRVWDELGIRGEGVVVGILDTGVMGTHPALTDRWRGNFAPASECWLDVIGDDPNFPTDYQGHGTHVMGTITGLAADDTVGVAPGALWIGCNVINQSAGPGFDSDVLTSLEFMTDPDGDPGTTDDVPDVVQNSWGINENFSGSPPYVDCDSRWWEAIDACEAAGVVITWSAGNEGPGSQSLRSPADRATSLYNVFSVGSTIHSPPFTISSFSSRGPAGPNCGPDENRMKPEISAPGDEIYSSTNNGSYGYKSGTSMAGPHVAGVVALMRSANPNLDVITIKQVIMETAMDLGQVGEDNTYGHGFIDAYACVLAVMEGLGYLEGTVIDAATNEPVEGVQIQVVGGYQSDVTDANGVFNLTLQQGPVTLQATRFGYLLGEYEVTIVEDETIYETFALEPAPTVTLSGTVFDPAGDPVAGAVVEPLGVPIDAVISGAGGYYAIDLPSGLVYDFTVELAGIGRVEESLDIQTPLSHDFHLRALGAHAIVAPQTFDESLQIGQQSSRILTVSNTGADPLVWRLAAEEPGKALPKVKVWPQATMQLEKGQEDPREGNAPDKDYGGPDNYGYQWVDSNEPGGPVYDWFDISGLGQTVGNSDDETYGPFAMGFDFPYYGSTYAQVSICTNGFVTFQNTTADPYTNQPLPNTDTPNLMVCPFWDDLNPSAGGNIYRYFDADGGRYIVQWDGVPHYYDEGSYTFQVIIEAGGRIVFQYQSLTESGSCTVGIENQNGTDGLEVVYNSGGYIENGLAIALSAGSQVPWLDYDPIGGSVGAGETIEVEIFFDATGLALGDYVADMSFISNDAAQSVLPIPVTLSVIDDTTPVGDTPAAFQLADAVPNPFNPQTTLYYSLPLAGSAQLKVFDVQGRLVRTLVDGLRPAGTNQATWDGRDNTGRRVASGTYYARLVAAGQTSVKSLVLVK